MPKEGEVYHHKQAYPRLAWVRGVPLCLVRRRKNLQVEGTETGVFGSECRAADLGRQLKPPIFGEAPHQKKGRHATISNPTPD